MEELIVFFITFIIVFLIYYIFAISRKKYLDKFMNGKEIMYLKYRYKIKVKDKDKKQLATIIALANAFIISFTLSIIMFINSFFIQLILGIVLVLGLILIVYHIIGKIYQKK